MFSNFPTASMPADEDYHYIRL